MKATVALALACILLAGSIFLSRERGEYAAKIKSLDSANAVLRAVKARVDTIHTQDSVRFVQWRVRYDTLRATDTLTLRDTLYVRKEIADSTISACSVVLNSCERAKAVRDSIIFNRDSALLAVKRMAEEAAKEAKREKMRWGFFGAATGALACSVFGR